MVAKKKKKKKKTRKKFNSSPEMLDISQKRGCDTPWESMRIILHAYNLHMSSLTFREIYKNKTGIQITQMPLPFGPLAPPQGKTHKQLALTWTFRSW